MLHLAGYGEWRLQTSDGYVTRGDRGAARLQLRAQNVDAVVDAMKRAGLTIVSHGGTAVPIPPNFKGALVADPNNFFLTPFAPCDGCAARLP